VRTAGTNGAVSTAACQAEYPTDRGPTDSGPTSRGPAGAATEGRRAGGVPGKTQAAPAMTRAAGSRQTVD